VEYHMRKLRFLSWIAISALVGIGGVSSTAVQSVRPEGRVAAAARIYVDSDVRVSHDGSAVHMETYVAASATDPNLLFAAGEVIFPGRSARASQALIYRSSDAGARWAPVLLPDEMDGGWDNAIAGGLGGSAYFLTSNSKRGLTLYRTADAGSTWIATPLGLDWDRPYIAVDTTDDAFRGSVYIVGEAKDGVRLTRSADGGKTFSPSVTACPHPNDWNAATSASPLVLRDGAVAVPCLPYPNDPERASWTNADVGLVFSRDGGRTFSPYRKVFKMHRLLERDAIEARAHGLVALSGNFMQGPVFAVGPPGGRFADRMYAAWQDVDSNGGSRLLTARSDDRGVTWSTPVPVNSSSNAGGAPSRECVPMIAASRDGVLGVAWFDGRHVPDGKGYDIYFSASEDGGQTFLPAARVSSASSVPASGLNVLPAFDVTKPEAGEALKVEASSPYSDRATGGDYSSMAVDAVGRFHPLWADAPSGAWQVYTASIRVLTPDAFAKLLGHTTCPLNHGDVQIVFDEPALEAAANHATVPVRIVNSSASPITGTIAVQISAGTPAKDDGVNLVFRFTPDSPLFPNSISAPQQWNFRVPLEGFRSTSFDATITGPVCGKSAEPQ
jgi:hypothetical protein